MTDILSQSVAEKQQPQLLCIAPSKVAAIWPHVERFFAWAYDKGIGDDDLASLKADVDTGRQLIWIVWDGRMIVAAAATKLVQLPRKKLCVLTACGGQQLSRWHGFKTSIEDYARAEGCDAMRVMGRKGWKQVFSDYHEPWICLEKEL